MSQALPWKSVYPETPSVVDWMSHRLLPIEQRVFAHWRGIYHLVRMVRDVEDIGLGPRGKYAALSAIKEYNDDHGTCLTYNEVRDLNDNYIFSGAGDWAVFTDNKLALVLGEYDDPDEAFYFAPSNVLWVVLWLVQDQTVVVYRSPHTAYRERLNDNDFVSDGLCLSCSDYEKPGTVQAYTLPADIEGSIRQDLGSADIRVHYEFNEEEPAHSRGVAR